jgi:hypothetical protein
MATVNLKTQEKRRKERESGRTELILDELLKRLNVLDSGTVELSRLADKSVALVAVSVLGRLDFCFEFGAILLALVRLSGC